MPVVRQETGLSISRRLSKSSPQQHADGDSRPGDLTSYKGNCHCGRNRFEVTVPAITRATGCNCSLCHKSGYLWAFPGEGHVQYTKGGADTLGEFETEALRHEFCTSCGTGLYGTHKTGPLEGKLGVNIRTFIGVNPFKTEVETIDTSASIKETPVPLPDSLAQNVSSDDETKKRVYTGSCQCGTVAFTVVTPALKDVQIKEDNCSICVRRAAASIYPDKDQVTLVGEDNTTAYAFGRKFNLAPFCKTCGVACYGVPLGPPQELVGKLPEAKQKFVEQQRRIRPLYIRAMNGVEWEEINVERSDEGTDGYVLPEDGE
ncbi:hypothetical protein M406DRAFT_73921 [Cryphonectria parasitica EP155]|uniref:CENP-V/GFA domain-containing protein n=1 Tax=Cryphonectria parasitica (strain ATCC 38755 / EP155) TaxID=660469 RepID=A0A9P4XYL9_CRYP1|nr:uncharacterized protein M406DRAFT_73921 [Cryphonectria parasitica EP155]KAF3763304.1 hypothetical protein M406DRAFT_73921 [Cryphonectria parasitica EP155]